MCFYQQDHQTRRTCWTELSDVCSAFQYHAFFLNLGSIPAQCVPAPFPINWIQAELVLAAESRQPILTENRTADKKEEKGLQKGTDL